MNEDWTIKLVLEKICELLADKDITSERINKEIWCWLLQFYWKHLVSLLNEINLMNTYKMWRKTCCGSELDSAVFFHFKKVGSYSCVCLNTNKRYNVSISRRGWGHWETLLWLLDWILIFSQYGPLYCWYQNVFKKEITVWRRKEKGTTCLYISLFRNLVFRYWIVFPFDS